MVHELTRIAPHRGCDQAIYPISICRSRGGRPAALAVPAGSNLYLSRFTYIYCARKRRYQVARRYASTARTRRWISVAGSSPSFMKIRLTWVSTVLTPRKSFAAIAWLE